MPRSIKLALGAVLVWAGVAIGMLLVGTPIYKAREIFCLGLSLIIAIWSACLLLQWLEAVGLPARNRWLLAGLLTAGSVLVLQHGSWWWLMEMLLTAWFLVGVAQVPCLRSFLVQLPSWHRLAWAALIGAMLVGHFARSDYQTFPFVVWPMYGRVISDPAIHHHELVGTDGSDQRILLNPEQLFPSVGRGSMRLTNRIYELTQLASSGEDPTAPASLNELLQAFARAYRTRGGLELERIDIDEVITPLDGSPARRKRIWSLVVRRD